MAKIRFTPHSEADISDIWAFIAADNMRAADGVYHRIMHRIGLASEQPQMGSPRPELGPSARILVEGRYIVIYEPQADGVLVVAIVHGMRNPETWLG